MHHLLQRQLKHNLGKDFKFSTLDDSFKNLLKEISLIYEKNDEEDRVSENKISFHTDELNTLLREKLSLLELKIFENQDSINLLNQYKNAINESFIVCTISLDGKIHYINNNFCKISGYTEAELLNKPFKINKKILEHVENTILNKQISNSTVLNLRKNGEIYYLNITFVPFLNREEEVKEVIYFGTDVSKEVLHQEEIDSQRKRIKTILNNQENIVIIIDEKEGIIDVNQRFFEAFNFNSLEEYKKNIDNFSNLFKKNNLYFDEKLDETQWFKQFLLKTNHLYKISKIDKMGNNQIFSVHCKNIILSDKTHYLCTLIDITELENAREKAEIAQRAKSMFLANMSHEIRTPLNAIMGFSTILSESNLDKENKENANIISKSAKSLLNIINDVLDISKIESGKIDIINEVFIFETFIENIVELFSVASKEKKIRFIYNPDYDLPYTMISDSMRLQQVLSNFLSNAIKFTPKNGEIIFSIKILEKVNEKIKIRFSIKDSGIGMSEDQQKIIFKPFFQADDGISRKYGGTGLGLSICSDIVKLMNSKIEVISQFNKGSEFRFDLDLIIDKQEDENKISNKNNLKFLLYCDEKNSLFKANIQNHIQKLGQIFDYSSDDKYADILFCCMSANLETILKEFKQNNKKSFIIFIGDETNIKNNNLEKYISNYINLPIYGSKLFNIISENLKLNNAVIKKVSSKKIKLDGKILIAEDNLNNQKLIQILLNKLSLKSHIVSNGKEAVEAYKKDKYDLILMDINMPIMDGVSATKQIREFEKNSDSTTPIIALTANSIAGDKERYLAQGMSDYLSKPIEFDVLVKILNKYLKKDSLEITNLNKIDIKTVSIQLEIPLELSEKLCLKFKEEIQNDLDELDSLIKNNNKNELIQKLYYIKNSCLNINLQEAIQILEKMQNEYIDSKSDLQIQFNKLNTIIIYTCDL